ncbi:DNA-binding protein [Halobacteriales archaeon QS_8_69_26]|nr:MAG: DNA-binding protein [Halobacteriales archaeon QS_8_69_26]
MDWITHEEDVWFEFRGNSPDQLEPDRYYRGTVDGFADFGVFVDIGDSVTGLLHESELETRLESLDWDPGDEVFVQVKTVRDNGNVDLGWSIRQSADEFRGSRIHDPGADEPVREREGDSGGGSDDEFTPSVRTVSGESEADGSRYAGGSGQAADASDGSATTAEDDGGSADRRRVEDPLAELDRVTVESLSDRVGDLVLIEGVVAEARQTAGPTVFEVRDETATVDCAAFEAAGVRAYPEVEADDAVRLVGEVELRHGELQVETETLEAPDGDDARAVEDRLEAAIESEARPPDVDPLADHPAVEAVDEDVDDAATAIRRAVAAARPVVVRHSATADGYAGGAAIERAVLPLVREEHPEADAEYHFFERRPLEGDVYDMDDATNDVTDMLEARERHGEGIPLVVLVDAGGTRESAAGYGLLDVYGADRVAIDGGRPDPEVTEEVDTLVSPALAEAGETSATALAAEVALRVNPEVRSDLVHLPALSYWVDRPAAYGDLAADSGYDDDRIDRLREALAFEAYYQSYEDKREIVADLLFPDGEVDVDVDADDFATHLSGQFRERLEAELETATRNLGIREARGISFAVLDTEAYTHRFDFPPTELLLDELHRRQREDYDRLVTIGLDEDTLYLRSTESVDVRAVGDAAAEDAEDAGVTVVGGRDGRVEFLKGERDAVLEAVVAAVAERLD